MPRLNSFNEVAEWAMATEGIISRIKNRKVSPTSAGFMQSLTKYKNLDELIATLQNGDQNRDTQGLVEGFCVSIRVCTKTSLTITPQHVKAIKTIFSNIGAAQKLLAQKIVNTYNSTKGERGPWAWNNVENFVFKPMTTADVTSKIKLEELYLTIANDLHDDGIEADFYFDDGELWYGHVIILHNCVDPKTGRMLPSNTPNIRYEIAG